MSQPTEPSPTIEIDVAVDKDTLERIDALLPLLSTPERQATGADALEVLIRRGLEVKEAKASQPAARRKPKGSP